MAELIERTRGSIGTDGFKRLGSTFLFWWDVEPFELRQLDISVRHSDLTMSYEVPPHAVVEQPKWK